MVLVLQQSSFLDSVHLDMDKICQCLSQFILLITSQRLLKIFAAAPTELFRIILDSSTMLLASSCRSTIFGNPVRCVNQTLNP